MGTKLSSGQLEITDTDLILYQKGKQPIKWPLKYLKRYGFEVKIEFSYSLSYQTKTLSGRPLQFRGRSEDSHGSGCVRLQVSARGEAVQLAPGPRAGAGPGQVISQPLHPAQRPPRGPGACQPSPGARD